ncbi:MAG TPA: hypothetical protein VHY20_01595, partial [Pirellulales bacterium]|nr:hypothetical protein [Pirellulales bacterium]
MSTAKSTAKSTIKSVTLGVCLLAGFAMTAWLGAEPMAKSPPAAKPGATGPALAEVTIGAPQT